MPEPVNLADVARLAKVSPATASRALSDHPHVAAATRARVWEAARALEYVVSPDAAGLARGTTGRIAVVVPHLSRWWFGAALEGLSEVLREAGRDLLLYHLGDAAARRAFFAELPARRRADAVVLLGFGVDDAERARLERIGVGIVSAGTRIGHHPSVSIDERVAGRQAVDHLLHLGHRRIGMIGMIVTTDPELDPGQPAGRAAAYRAALADAGVGYDPALTVRVPWSPEGGARAMGELLGLSDPPTAVYAHTDEVALGAVGTLRRAGLAVPGDVSVIGIDDHPLAALTDLSTVAQPAAEQGAVAARMALATLAGDPVDPLATLPTRLVIRGSTAPPARGARGVS